MKYFLSCFLAWALAFPPLVLTSAWAEDAEYGSSEPPKEYPSYQAVSGQTTISPVYAALFSSLARRRARYSGSGFGATAMTAGMGGSIFAVASGSKTPSSEVESTLVDLGSSWALSTIADVELAIGTGRGRAQKFEATLKPKLTANLPLGFKLTGIGRLRTDAFDELEPGRPRPQEVSSANRRAQIGDRSDAEIRELFIEKTFGESYIKIGKQQIVWGESDGLKVLDVVDPQDFREFILPNFDESRIPLWSVNAEVPIKNFALQLLFVPDPTGHELAEPDSVFAVTSKKILPEPPPGVRLQLNKPDRRARFLDDADVGFRVSTFLGGADLTFNYLYRYDDFPVLRRSFSNDAKGPTVVVDPEFERSTLIGATLSKAIGNLTVRSEVGYSIDKFLPVEDPKDRDGVVRTNDVSYVLGLDYFGFENNVLSGQFFQSIASKDPRGLLRDQVETNFTFVYRREMMNNALRFELIWLVGVNEDDGLVRPELRYEVRDDLAIRAGFDLFYGSGDGMFGQFGKRDRVTLGVELGF